MRGRMKRRMPLPQGVGEMTSPARCRHCAKVYDLGAVEVIARYADCSAWQCPGCKRQVDDRGETGWTANKHYDRIERVSGGLDVYGNLIGWDH